MDENPPKGNPAEGFNKIDLSQLQGFSFGTQWTEDKSAGPEKEARTGGARRDRSDSGVERRDRRLFRRPAGSENEGPAPGLPERRALFDPPRPQRLRRELEGARDGVAAVGAADPRRPRRPDRGEPAERHVPYDSPHFSVTFYPEDASFDALVKTIRASCRTIELFEIARTVLGKPERFTVNLARKAPEVPSPAPLPPIFVSVPDGLPFESEEAAVAHVLRAHLGSFFDSAEVEIDPPKGNFQMINRCPFTGELLGPPNYHRYGPTLQQHFAAKIRRLTLEEYRNRIESVRDPEVIQQWLNRMKKVTRYRWREPGDSGAAAAVPPGEASAGAAPPSFDTLEEARAYLLERARDKVVRESPAVRFHGRMLEGLPDGEIRRAVEGALERQRRFPLDTANALRGRLRREHFTVFKKGAKGISYVCAVKRRFRVPGQTFAEGVGALISFIETHSLVKTTELVGSFLGLPAEKAGAGGDAASALARVLSVEQRERVVRLQADLLWLVREGYVTEFIDGRLYAPPPTAEVRPREAEGPEDDHDPENFPEAPLPQAEEPAPAVGEAEVQVPGVGGEPPAEVAGPLDGQAPGA